jgi:formamidopyrimidine-DNA glycosylase
MPELPEVENVVRGLREVMLGRTITKVRSYAPPASVVIGRSFGRKSLNAALKDRRIHNINRRGKNILIGLTGDVTLWVHLKMTGQFRHVEYSTPLDKHDLVTFDFEPGANGHLQLRFNDYRRFGRLRVFPDDELWHQKGLAELGPEPLEMSADNFVQLCHRRNRMIWPALLDQSFIAGLGSIYASESLYLSRLHARRLTSSITRRKLAELHGHIRRLLRRSIGLMGTTVDTYTGVNGRPGSFQRYLKAYGNEGQPCGFCGTKIVREKIGSRSAHFCPRCQRNP